MAGSILSLRTRRPPLTSVEWLKSQQRSVYINNEYERPHRSTSPSVKPPRFKSPLKRPVVPDQILIRHAILALRLKWINALPRRIKWSKRIAWMGAPMVAGLGVLWLTNQEEVPSSGRKRLNFFTSGKLRKYFIGHDYQFFLPVCFLRAIVALAPQNPGLIWPQDHPTALVVESVFDGLLASSGIDPAGWKIYIANAPGK